MKYDYLQHFINHTIILFFKRLTYNENKINLFITHIFTAII